MSLAQTKRAVQRLDWPQLATQKDALVLAVMSARTRKQHFQCTGEACTADLAQEYANALKGLRHLLDGLPVMVRAGEEVPEEEASRTTGAFHPATPHERIHTAGPAHGATPLCMYTQLASSPVPLAPTLTTLDRAPDPQGSAQADALHGTLHPDAVPGSVPVRAGLHFKPAWDPAEEAHARQRFLDLTPEAATREAQAQVMQAARRRALHGVSWRFERVTVRVLSAGGEVLACRSVGGVPSDQARRVRAELERDLTREALADARDWAILGLN